MYKGYIYRHWLINDKEQEKSYIGQTIESNIENRWGRNRTQVNTLLPNNHSIGNITTNT